MRLLLDRNGYRDFCMGERRAVDLLQRADEIHLPFVTLAALRSGFACGTVARRNEAVLVRFLNSPRVRVALATEETTHHYARLFFQLRKQGTPIPTNDIWIAALAVQHNLPLFTSDKHFDHLPQLARMP
jgi:tRNA(fMet)-specific endonuclease VapC